MKLYTINPLYTSLFSVIIFAALTSSFSMYIDDDGKTYLDLKYEIEFGGSKTLKVDGTNFVGLKSYRKLTVNQQLKLRKKKENIAIQMRKKREEQEIEEENKRRQLEEEKKRDQKRLDAEKAQLEAERVQRETEVPISQKPGTVYLPSTPKIIQNKKPSRVASRKKLPQKQNKNTMGKRF